MLRLWLTRRWLVGTLVAIVFGFACFMLGRWQWGRYVEKQTKATAIATNYDAAPVPLTPTLLGVPLSPERQWTRVTAHGTYAAEADLLVRNRTLNTVPGFEVLTVLTTQAGTILVDRGWVPNATTAAEVPGVDAPPQGPVEVTGWLRTGEPSLGRDLPAGQLASIDIDDARTQRPAVGPADIYLVLGAQSPATPASGHPVTPLPRPTEDLGPHQAYAIQWWITMPGGIAFVFWAVRREVLARDETEDGAPAPPKPKKVRIWDEEDY
ncbi:MAG: SURF1 family protein [Intrasporangium sp.]|uniref:SURF1 family cytochrome oxidase biogenesis protein n=1 Tax=Intrasporangium sp. TaxID=1925024 RepID=UPI002648D4DF|nr:SURF1 family protein [Intrasporangium sp.]MDN5796293.1 SURF1 family protein [Intrasporangium sp.]